MNVDTLKILGSLLNSGALSKGSGSNVLGSIIGALAGGGNRSQGGGLGGLLGSLLGGGSQPQAQGGGLGGLTAGLGGGGQSSGGGLGDLLGMAMKQFGQATGGGSQVPQFDAGNNPPSQIGYEEASDQATILIRAMINAAKSDGHVDQEEQKKIVGKLGKEITQDEIDFVRGELAEPLNVDKFIRSIPRGMEQQVYAMSLMAIDLDTNTEAQYLHLLAQGMGLSPQQCNQIHQQLGVQQIYS